MKVLASGVVFQITMLDGVGEDDNGWWRRVECRSRSWFHDMLRTSRQV